MKRLTLMAFTLAIAQTASADDAPKMLAPNVISTDGNEIYFSRSVPRSYMYAIYVSRKIGGAWSEPQLVPFSGHGRDFDPVMAPDGKRMVFISDRSVELGKPKLDYDIWMVDRLPDGRWNEPRNVGAPVDTTLPDNPQQDEGNEWFASL